MSKALDAIQLNFANRNTDELIQWSVETFGDGLVMSSSFGIHSAITLHLVTRHLPEVPVVFVDTGYALPETYQYAQVSKIQKSNNLII